MSLGMKPVQSPQLRPSQRGSIAHAAILLIAALSLMAIAGLIYARACAILSSAVDYIHETAVETKTFEKLVAEAILAKVEVTTTPNGATLDSLLDNQVALVNSGSSNLTFARVAASGALPSHVFYPDVTRPAISIPDLTSAGSRYQVKSLIQYGAATVGAPQTYDFTRTVTGGTSGDGKTIRVVAQLWSVPVTNWSTQAYGLPASIAAGAGVPRAAPTNAAAVIGGRPMILTTLRPSPAYSPGDTTAYDQLYTPPTGPAPEVMPAFYRPLASINWNLWEYVWNTYVPMTLRTNATNTYDFAAFSPTVPTGVTVNSSTNISVNLATVPGGILMISDGVGGSTVTLNGAGAQSTPLVIAIYNPTGTATNVTIAGNNNRSVIVYFMRSTITVSGSPTWNGALFLDQNSTASGTLALNGCFGYCSIYAPFPTLTLTLSVAAGQVYTDLQDIAPRVLLASTTSSLF